MKRSIIIIVGFLASSVALTDDVSDAERLLCSTSEVQICFETGECHAALPWQIDMPQFVIIDTRRKLISTTAASGENRSTPITTLHREDGRLVLQGYEQGRAFSAVVEESLGAFSAAIARDGVSVSAFGSCTDSEKL